MRIAKTDLLLIFSVIRRPFGLALLLALLLIQPVTAQIPENYYDSIVGKSGYQLKSALSAIIYDHTELIYGGDYPGGLWHAFRTTDVRPDGYVWDIYSNCNFVPWEDGHVAGSGECMGGTQQEHTFCQSWMNYCETPLLTDMFHMYPVDGWVNGRRNNNPFGEVPDDPDWTTRWFQNGARLGYNSFVGEDMTSTCGIAYEPADQYKGDIARGFLYIAVCYMFADEEFSEDYEMTLRSQLRPWALDLMLKWHRQDPVSQKEIDRNNLIYTQFQHNRNPFIDYPELAELIFAKDSANAVFSPSMARAPQQLTVSPDPGGRRRAVLSWVNPLTCINGDTAVLTSVVVQRNGVTIHVFEQPQAGEEVVWTDHAVPSDRTYEYRVFATTQSGNGLLSAAKAFVGRYCPVTVELFDSYYDGWQGDARIEFQDTTGELLAFSKLPCGEGWANLFDVKLPPETIHCVWVPGTNDEQNSFRLYDSELDMFFAAEAADVVGYNGTFYTFVNDGCPLPAIPDTTYCDSIVCDYDLPLLWNGVLFTSDSSNDTVVVVLSNQYQQDSVVVMRVAVVATQMEECREIVENQLPYEWNGHIFTEAGTQVAELPQENGCTLSISMALIVHLNDYVTQTRTVCDDELPYTWDGLVFESEGVQEVLLANQYGADSVVRYCLVVDTCAGIAESTSPGGVRLWPNPVQNILHVACDGIADDYLPAELRLYDVRGRLIDARLLKEPETQIDLNNLAAGIYTVRVVRGNQLLAVRKISKSE